MEMGPGEAHRGHGEEAPTVGACAGLVTPSLGCQPQAGTGDFCPMLSESCTTNTRAFDNQRVEKIAKVLFLWKTEKEAEMELRPGPRSSEATHRLPHPPRSSQCLFWQERGVTLGSTLPNTPHGSLAQLPPPPGVIKGRCECEI